MRQVRARGARAEPLTSAQMGIGLTFVWAGGAVPELPAEMRCDQTFTNSFINPEPSQWQALAAERER